MPIKRFFLWINISIRRLLGKISPEHKKRFIGFYIKNQALYGQGSALVSSFRIISFDKIVTGMACIKIIWPDVDPWIIAVAGLIYYPLRTLFNWSMGLFWETSNGYKIQADWNQDRMPPIRVFVQDHNDKDNMFEKPGENF